MISRELTDKLVCAKYIFLQGKETLEKGTPYASGLALLAFQDSLEMVLRIIIEELQLPSSEKAAFHTLVEEIEKKVKITHKTALMQINKARVNFKHYGLEPNKKDVDKFENDLEVFFTNILNDALHIDFAKISLAKLIKHQRACNFLMKAENYLQSGDYKKSIESSAIAFELYLMCFHEDYEDQYDTNFIRNVSTLDGVRSLCEVESIVSVLKKLADNLTKNFEELSRERNIMAHGITLHEYRKFKYYSPDISLPHIGWCGYGKGESFDYQTALFCYNFSLDSILKMQNGGFFVSRRTNFPSQFYEITSISPILVYPEKEEIIRNTEIGERFQAHYQKNMTDEYVAIVFDNDIAYIDKDSVKEVQQA
jgi:hypothetical protein